MRARLQQWLGFIGTEIHKAIFIPLLDPHANDAVKAYARDKIALRMDVLQQHLERHEFLLPAILGRRCLSGYRAQLGGVHRCRPRAMAGACATTSHGCRSVRTWREHSATNSRCIKPAQAKQAAAAAMTLVSIEAETAAVIRRFNDAFQLHDPSLLDDLIAPDCVLENSTPAPNGSRHVGREACLALWKGIVTTPGTRFDLEDVVCQRPTRDDPVAFSLGRRRREFGARREPDARARRSHRRRHGIREGQLAARSLRTNPIASRDNPMDG